MRDDDQRCEAALARVKRLGVTVAVVVTVGAAAGVYSTTRSSTPAPAAPLDQVRAEQLAASYRTDTVALMPNKPTYAEAGQTFTPCGGRSYQIATRYDVAFATADPAGAQNDAFTVLSQSWKRAGYRVVEETGGQARQLLVSNPRDQFSLGLIGRTGRGVRLSIASPCVALATTPLQPLMPGQLTGPRGAYQAYAAGQLSVLNTQVTALRTAIAAHDLPRSRSAWLSAQLTWEHVGAAYGSFGDLAEAVGGLPDALPLGPKDPRFTGLHRLEYDLWHGAGFEEMLPVAARLRTDLAKLRAALPELAINPADLPLRAHEILEDALRDHLSGLSDQGAGAGLAETYADVEATRAVLGELAPLIRERRPGLLEASLAGLDNLSRVLLATRHGAAWPGVTALPPTARGQVEAATGAVLETLAPIPDVLELSGT